MRPAKRETCPRDHDHHRVSVRPRASCKRAQPGLARGRAPQRGQAPTRCDGRR
ncbi:hypothetical protein G6O69_35180 [Pseudenhygromyxa sp. WMMC2535]|uniref:hypothetical protein n=1 Tax=Pseudenhygromyxa sp. WMMC2535 TaxID=2712867 RepID=UPI001594FD45|nr:hypothetical protein [Pseudenhygromyxa sp. WMMC2535]NVB43120.1 hypothetical protein [Pseudenhygromyxa sp. WMMC2535]